MLSEPSAEPHKLLAQTVDRLLVHVGLRNQLGKRHYSVLARRGIQQTDALTKEACEMLGTIGVARASVVTINVLPRLVKLVVLASLEPGACESVSNSVKPGEPTYRAEYGLVPCRNTRGCP